MEARRHDEVMRCLFRETDAAMILYDPHDLSVVDLNPAAMRLSGYDLPGAVGVKVTDLFDSRDGAEVDGLLDGQDGGLRPLSSAAGFSLRAAGGSRIAVELSATRVDDGHSSLGLVLARETDEGTLPLPIAERIFRDSSAMMGLVDRDGRLTVANRALLARLGGAAEGAAPWAFLDLLHPSDRAEVGDALETGRGYEEARPVLLREPSGEYAPVLLSLSRSDGQTCLTALTVARGPSGGESGETKAAPRPDQSPRRPFLSNMSHEFRTPLTAILALIDILIDDPSSRSLCPDRQVDLKTIRRNGEHLLQLINSVLDLAKIEAGKLGLRNADCDPERLAIEVSEMIRVRSEAKGLPLIVENATKLPARISTDPTRLRQILINLLSNAVKFTEAGAILIRLSQVVGPEGTPAIRFEVMDSGPGIGPDELPHLFQPFEQLGHLGLRAHGGTGLGLAISRGLAEALCGTLTVESRRGYGSTFILTIPFAAPSGGGVERPSGVTPDEPPATERARRRVLLAEDNADNRRAITIRLEQAGLEVVAARNGQEAVDRALDPKGASEAFDIVLMDMQMPVLDGYEATRQLRDRGYHGSIVALTAFAMDEDREECLKFGCDGHVCKPIDWNELLAMIECPPRAVPREA